MRKPNNTLILSESFDPWFNLAIEEYSIAKVKNDEIILFIWQNSDCVVIGSNQNPWKECSTKIMQSNGIKLARRLSGGGAVFHDTGNLNFTFLAGNDVYDSEKQLNIIMESIKSFGLNPAFSGRNDLMIGDKKVSGNAYFYGENASFHHGTILVDSDIEKLAYYLTPSKQKINSKGIGSVRNRVINLKTLNSSITVKCMKEKILEIFQQDYGDFQSTHVFSKNKSLTSEFQQLLKKYSSWEWVYGESPSFEIYHEDKFAWGEVAIGLSLIDGKIDKIKIYSDSLVTTFTAKLTHALLGRRFEKKDIYQAIQNINRAENETVIFNDIKNLFEHQL